MTDITQDDATASNEADPTELSLERREALLAGHPILEREYTLPTPVMQRTYGLVRERVWARRTGIVFHAPPRMGKTRCAMAIKELIMAEFPQTHVTLLSVRSTTRPSAGHMYRLILEAESHALSERPNADRLYENAKADILLKTSLKGGSQFVLLIDEMQLLNVTDLQQLVCFHNALDLAKVKMTTVSFAQPEILHRRSALMTTNDRQIIARFLSEPLTFDGCASMAELRTLLIAYDEASEYPEGSGWSYTRFFFPVAFAHGFRLANYVACIWAPLANAAGPGTNGMLPMEHVCLTIEHLLLALHKHDCVNFMISDEDARLAVEAANLQTFSMLMSDTANA
jgi:hypothetical protein